MAEDLETLLRVRGGSRLRSQLFRVPWIARGRPRAYWYRSVPNLGDQMSPRVLEWMTGVRPVWVPANHPRKVLSTGSILHALSRGDLIWGSGLIQDEKLKPPPGTQFLAVRGPLTRQRIAADVPEIYGDPAILLPLFHRSPCEKTHDIGLIPHYVDQEAIGHFDPAIRLIDVRKPWDQVVTAIRSCHVILSSSLHGLIVAESFGIPATWVKITDGIKGGGFKFNDYYLGSGRDTSAPTRLRDGIDKALRATAPPPEHNQQGLIDAGLQLKRLLDPSGHE